MRYPGQGGPSRAARQVAVGLRPAPGGFGATQRRTLRLAVARHRRLAVAGLTAAAAAAAVAAGAPAQPATDSVWVAARDLPVGQRLTAGDLRQQVWPESSRPDGTPRSRPIGVLAGPLRRGEPVTDARLLGPALLTGQGSPTVAISVRLTDPAATAVVTPGSRVDVLAVPRPGDLGTPDLAGATARAGSGSAEVVASNALVLALPGSGSGSSGWDDPTAAGGSSDPSGWLGGLGPADPAGSTGGSAAGILVLAVDRTTAARLAAAQASRSLTVTLN